MALNVAIPREKPGEHRVAMTPQLITRLVKMGLTVKVQSGAGEGISASDSSFKDANIVSDPNELRRNTKIILSVGTPSEADINSMDEGAILVSFIYGYNNPNLIKKLLEKKITAFAMEMVPRISRAQDIDALSSQATISGYKAVILAANTCRYLFPMLSTAAGTVKPAKVLIIGAGVAGLQAIASAKRLGAIVEAYDVRQDTKEQVQSLGAKFVETNIVAEGTGGYARELTAEEKQAQQELLKKHVIAADVIITTAGVPGKPAPKIITKDMVDNMKPGAVIVDIMAEMGGNCELTKSGENVIHNNITILGPVNLPSMLANNSSEMYARNILNLLNLFIKDGAINLNWEDEIIKGTVITHEGKITNAKLQEQLEGKI